VIAFSYYDENGEEATFTTPVISRTLTGIQAILDTYEVAGEETQTEFLSTIDSSITNVNNKVEELSQELDDVTDTVTANVTANVQEQVEEIVKEQIKETSTTTIIKVTKEQVLSADVIEASASFITDLQVDRLRTNISKLICTPNITVEDDVASWTDGSPTYKAKTTVDITGYIEIEGITHKYIECHLVKPSSYLKMTQSEVQELKVGGKQLYFTSINGSQAFNYLTYATPQSKYDMTDENAEMFKVYIRKTESEYIKLQHIFSLNEEETTYNVVTQYGTGDGTGKGVYQFAKDGESGELVYIGREDGLKYGIRMDDTGLYLLNGQYTATVVPPTHILDSATEDTSDIPEGHLVFIPTSTDETTETSETGTDGDS
jgi:hypothetical protein